MRLQSQSKPIKTNQVCNTYRSCKAPLQRLPAVRLSSCHTAPGAHAPGQACCHTCTPYPTLNVTSKILTTAGAAMLKMVMMDCSSGVRGPLGAMAGVTSSRVTARANAGRSSTLVVTVADICRKRSLRDCCKAKLLLWCPCC